MNKENCALKLVDEITNLAVWLIVRGESALVGAIFTEFPLSRYLLCESRCIECWFNESNINMHYTISQ